MAAAGKVSSRFGQALMGSLVMVGLASCGGSVVPIPKGTPTPKAQLTSIAPGVQVPSSQLQLPAYTTSVSHPLPNGVSAKKVVADVQIDNLIENAAIERQDPGLLAFADTGNWLAAEQGEVSQDQASGIKVISIVDEVQSVQVGTEVDPRNPAATIGVILSGVEKRVTMNGSSKPTTSTKSFSALLWLLWNPALKRYQICDTAAS